MNLESFKDFFGIATTVFVAVAAAIGFLVKPLYRKVSSLEDACLDHEKRLSVVEALITEIKADTEYIRDRLDKM